MDNFWFELSLWIALIFVAGLVSAWTGITVALIEILVGVIGGNFLALHANDWVLTFANLGILMLTFLAGAEIEPGFLKRKLKASLSIGLLAFIGPFVAAGLFIYFVPAWNLQGAEIGALALSTTSIAVIYAVLSQSNMLGTDFGKLLITACFIVDFSAVVVLGLLFARIDIWMAVFIAVLVTMLVLMPRITPRLIEKWGGHFTNIEAKYFILVLCVLGWLSFMAGSQAVLPAFLIGFISAGVLDKNRYLVKQIKDITFTVLVPFYFIKAGSMVSLSAVAANWLWIVIFLVIVVGSKFACVFPLARAFGMNFREGMYSSLLMSTGLTFGIISAVYGFDNNLINQGQYTMLIAAIIGSALIPSLIATYFFKPNLPAPEQT